MSQRRRPMACIVPPVLLKRLALEGDPDERINAIETIALDQSLRLARAETAGRRTPTQRSFPSLVSTQAQPNRLIHDQQHGMDVIGPVVRAEGQPPTDDEAVNEAYDGLGATYTFFSEVLGRDSIDGAGLVLRGLVHFGTNYNNAMWDGEEMIFGDGDGVLFSRFTAALDVIGHELTHGVTQYEANLVYSGQSGALNESLSDAFGCMVKQYALGQTADEADWLIGPDCVGEKLRPALRSMMAPGSANPYDDQPADMDGYVRTAEDHGGVHTNSGIPNHAFYLVAVALGGHAWERAGRIWYDALRDPRIRPNSGFVAFARATLRQASALYGTESDEAHAVQNAWNQVKVL
jgi:Zn-dependent metalloprotease